MNTHTPKLPDVLLEEDSPRLIMLHLEKGYAADRQGRHVRGAGRGGERSHGVYVSVPACAGRLRGAVDVAIHFGTIRNALSCCVAKRMGVSLFHVVLSIAPL